MADYKKVDVVSYVDEGLSTGKLQQFQAVKYARIIARKGKVGDIVTTWSVDSEGNEIKEKVGIVELDETTKEPGWIVTKSDESGNVIVDKNNHPNQWIIGDSKFKKKYEVDPENPSLFKPTGGVQTFVKIGDDIILHQWGEDMQIAAGGYINITDRGDMYGISGRDFDDTYKPVGSMEKDKTM